MSFESEHENLHYLTGEFVDAVVAIKHALADGKFDPDEVENVLRALDPALAEWISKLLKALKGLYPEVEGLAKLGPFGMMMQAAPYFASRLMKIFQ